MLLRSTLTALCACAFITAAAESHAQTGAKRPLRSIVVSPPGGPSDVQMRLFAPKMSEALGQTIVVDNRPSNNGVVGAELCARANTDGYTICVGNSGTHAINQTLYRKLPYDVVRDFQAIGLLGTTGLVVAIHPKLPANLQEFVAHGKKYAGKINIGIPGATGQFAGDALWKLLGISANNVNFRGSAPTEIALLAGEIDVALLTPLASMQHLKSGRMRALGISSVKRNALMPDLPTIMEQGVKGYVFEFWNGLFAPVGIAPALVKTLHQSMVHAANAPEVRERLIALGFTPGGEPPAQFAQFVKAEVEKFRRQIIESGVPLL
ncbi:MAG: tripartite tricarboxylate transporter substrate binding protein [Betaproteobacteria bacterium]|nr:tripartite tricarboxylate transporter substrate binding protein [Betaproteobacteria bacterium]